MATYLSSFHFLEEIKRWGTGKDSLIRVRMMKKDNLVYLKFHTPHGEVIQTSILEKDFNDFDFMNFGDIAVPAVWDDEITSLKRIEKRLEEINADTKTDIRSHIFGFRTTA
jgi:hypothetical protein